MFPKKEERNWKAKQKAIGNWREKKEETCTIKDYH